MPRIVSIVILLILVYYFYAIIGMEVFRGKVYQGCCKLVSFDVHVRMHVCICMYVYTGTYVCMCVYVRACVYVCMYVCM